MFPYLVECKKRVWPRVFQESSRHSLIDIFPCEILDIYIYIYISIYIYIYIYTYRFFIDFQLDEKKWYGYITENDSRLCYDNRRLRKWLDIFLFYIEDFSYFHEMIMTNTRKSLKFRKFTGIQIVDWSDVFNLTVYPAHVMDRFSIKKRSYQYALVSNLDKDLWVSRILTVK